MRTTETSREEINLQQRTFKKESKKLQQWKISPEVRWGRGQTNLRRWSLQRLLLHPCWQRLCWICSRCPHPSRPALIQVNCNSGLILQKPDIAIVHCDAADLPDKRVKPPELTKLPTQHCREYKWKQCWAQPESWEHTLLQKTHLDWLELLGETV